MFCSVFIHLQFRKFDYWHLRMNSRESLHGNAAIEENCCGVYIQDLTTDCELSHSFKKEWEKKQDFKLKVLECHPGFWQQPFKTRTHTKQPNNLLTVWMEKRHKTSYKAVNGFHLLMLW